MMKLGIDYGVFSQFPDRFGDMASSLIDSGHEVYLTATVSKRDGDKMLVRVQRFAIPYTVISMILTDRKEDIPGNILEYCAEYKLDMFIDAREDVCQFLRKNGMLTLYFISPA